MIADKSWVVYPLEKEVKRIVFPKGNIANLRRLSRQDKEYDGILMGVIQDDNLYFMGSTILGIGDETSVQFEDRYRKFHNELMLRSKQVQPSLTTILYHNHPRSNPRDFSPQELEAITYLQETRDVQKALQSFGRILSPSDVEATFGKAHVLVTDEDNQGEDFSHIHAYKVEKYKFPDEFEKFEVVPLSSRSKKEHYWAGGVCASLKKVYEDLVRERNSVKGRE
jgi:hypothetical protein